MCRDHKMPLAVYNMKEEGALVKLLQGENVGTIVEV